MPVVSKITCQNNAGFVMKFRVEWDSMASGWTDTYPNPQSASIDLHTLNIPKGAQVRTEIQAELGEHKHCKDTVEYDPASTESALYVISGTTLDIHCSLEGP
jgi:hypothetical protein